MPRASRSADTGGVPVAPGTAPDARGSRLHARARGPWESSIARAVTWVLLGLYSAVVVLVLTWPTPVDRPISGLLGRVLRALDRRGFGFIDYGLVEFTANIAMFVPIGFLLLLGLGRGGWAVALVIGYTASLAAELFQHVFLPERVASVLDVLANSLGALLGVLVALLVLRITRGRRAPRAHDRAAESVP